MKLSLSFDLGNDTLKMIYGLSYPGKSVFWTGKLDGERTSMQVGIPASALYDEKAKKWIFGNQINDSDLANYSTVVKIKCLLSLLNRPMALLKQSKYRKKDICKSYAVINSVYQKNRYFFEQGHDFPKFYFPVRRKMELDFSEMVENEMTFKDEKRTPYQVVLEYFEYIFSQVYPRITRALKNGKAEFDSLEIDYCIVLPTDASQFYKENLEKIILQSFVIPSKKKNVLFLTSPKALTVYAYERKAIFENENVLIFDMGEERISVVGACVKAGGMKLKINVDGADGHSNPLDVGGNDIDERINAFIEQQIMNKETIGTPSASQEGHISENSTHSKQYLLMNDIKLAKIIMSRNNPNFKEMFKEGVPINIYRETLIQRSICKEDVESLIGITSDSGIAREIADYMIKEIKAPINREVKKVVLAGGLIQTSGLEDYLRKKIETSCRGVKVVELISKDAGDVLSIPVQEEITYAASIGAVFGSVCNLDISMVLGVSYATWIFHKNERCLKFIAEKGTPLKKTSQRFYTDTVPLSTYDAYRDCIHDEFFSTIITQQDINKHKIINAQYFDDGVSDSYLFIDEEETKYRRKLSEEISLNLVSGGNNKGKIIFLYNGNPVWIKTTDKIYFREGVEIDADGNAKPIIENAIEDNKSNKIEIAYDKNGYRGKVVYAKDITVAFEGLNEFFITMS